MEAITIVLPSTPFFPGRTTAQILCTCRASHARGFANFQAAVGEKTGGAPRDRCRSYIRKRNNQLSYHLKSSKYLRPRATLHTGRRHSATIIRSVLHPHRNNAGRQRAAHRPPDDPNDNWRCCQQQRYEQERALAEPRACGAGSGGGDRSRNAREPGGGARGQRAGRHEAVLLPLRPANPGECSKRWGCASVSQEF